MSAVHFVKAPVSVESPLLIQSLSNTAKSTAPSKLDFSFRMVERGTFDPGDFQSWSVGISALNGGSATSCWAFEVMLDEEAITRPAAAKIIARFIVIDQSLGIIRQE